MAILPMNKVNLVAMKRDRRKIMDFLQRKGVVELTTPEYSDGVFTPVDQSQTVKQLEADLEIVQQANSILREYSDTKPSAFAAFNGPTYKSVKEYDDFFAKVPKVVEDAHTICNLKLQLNEAKSDILRWTAQEEELVPWKDLPIPLNYSGTQHTCCYVGSIPGSYTHGEILEKLAVLAPELDTLHLEVVYSGTEQTSLYIFALSKDKDALKSALDQLDFHYPAQRISRRPAYLIKELQEKKAQAVKDIESIEKNITMYTLEEEDLVFLADHLSIQIEKNQAMNSLSQSRHTFLLEGYVPVAVSEALEQDLTKNYDCILTFEEATPEDNPPVKLQNNWFSEPTESIVESYSLPGPRELDPTGIMSIFYYFMFGLMFSDAGYGLILMVATSILLLKFRNMPQSLNKSMRMFFWCGVSTFVWGLVFGTFFGDVVNAVSRTFFGNEAFALKALWFDPVQNPMKLLIFSMAIGVVHLIVGYLMNAATAAKNKDYSAILYDAGFPVVFIISVLIAFSATDIFKSLAGFKTSLPANVSTICLVIALVCCIGTVLFSGRESKSWVKRILKGLYGLYNMVSGWLSDILSYSRLLALGLATGIIGTVINTLGTLAGNSIIGLIVFLLAFVLGHALNFGINILGAYVHSNRLEYVEFFGKFYEGGGRAFVPLGIHTKNYQIREDLSNE